MSKYREHMLMESEAIRTRDPILAEVLAEARGTPNLKAIAMEFLKTVEQKSRKPQGFGGFEVAWAEQSYQGKQGAVNVLYDIPWEVRNTESSDPEEDFPHDAAHKRAVQQYGAMKKTIFMLSKAFKKKYNGIEFGSMGDWVGGGVKKTGTPRYSQ